MIEYAKVRQRDMERAAFQQRLADSLPRRHTWHLGRYRVTVVKPGDPQFYNSEPR